MSKHLQTLAKYCSFGVPIDQGQFKTYLAHVLFLDPAGVSCLAVLQTVFAARWARRCRKCGQKLSSERVLLFADQHNLLHFLSHLVASHDSGFVTGVTGWKTWGQ